MISLKFMFLLVLSLCFSSGAWAGWIIEQVVYRVPTSSRESAKQRIKSTHYFSRNRFKALQESSAIIINYDSDHIFVVDRGRKLYWDGTIDEYIEGIQDAVAQAKKQIEESLKSMSPEQRKAMEEEMKKQGLSLPGETNQPVKRVEIIIEKTPDKQTIAGYKATKYKVYTSEKIYQEVWISEDVSVFKEIDMKKAQDFQNRVNEALAPLYSDQSANNVERSSEYQKLFEKGYPLKTVQIVGQGKGIIEVIGAKETEVTDSEFEAIKGYRKTTLKEVMKMGVSSGAQ